MTQTKAVNQDVETVLRDRLNYFEQMFGAGEIDELVRTFYTEDAVVEGPGLPVQKGHRAIAAVFDEARKGFDRIEIEMDPVEHPSQDLIYGFITNRNRAIDGTIEVHRASIVWRRVDGQWLCQTDFFYPMK